MLNFLIVLIGKSVSLFSNFFNLGSGGTWPGHIALKLNKNFINQAIDSKTKIVLVAGTNGKTSTATLITHILTQCGNQVAHNKTGANQLNGIASAIISEIPKLSNKLIKDYLILEVDENVLPLALKKLTPNTMICLNLFRDQLDRYGEIDSIVKKWRDSFSKLSTNTTLILNADDPQMAILGTKKTKNYYFGLNLNLEKEIQHGADSIFCPNCQSELIYKTISFSHLGNWACPTCKLKRPSLDISSSNFFPLAGTYGKYITLAAILFAKNQKISQEKILSSIKKFKPPFGRQEKFEINGKKIEILLSKNPTSFNESLKTIKNQGAKNVLLVLNDHYVDGIDVSWIWDIDFENLLSKSTNIAVSGERVYDIAIRLKYAEKFTHIFTDLDEAINKMIENIAMGEKLYVLANYSAMLETRKILLGRKLL